MMIQENVIMTLGEKDFKTGHKITNFKEKNV